MAFILTQKGSGAWHVAVLVILTAIILERGQSQDIDRIYNLMEEEPTGSFVGNMARDLNLEAILPAAVFQSLKYSILAGDQGEYFRVDATNSDIFTSQLLDREDICRYESQCVLSMRIGAHSDTDLRKYTVAVNLLDVNDNPPRFNLTSYTLRIPESVTEGKKYTLPGALDDDRGGDNSIQLYDLSPSDGSADDTFGVEFQKKLDGTSDVSLVVLKTLDRESKDSYSFTLMAVDGGTDPGPRSGSIEVTVLVEDDNDHAPMFDQDRYVVQVGENTISGAVIQTLTARDEDIGVNAAVEYRLSVHQDASVAEQFEIGRLTGILTAKVALTSGSYVIIVEAVDGGSPQSVSQTRVEVTVIDTENNPPVITVDSLNEGSSVAIISEGASVNDLVAHVTALDPDTGPNGAVQCYSQSAFFGLNSLEDNDYLVVLAKTLDRESTAEFRVTIFCEDSGSPKLNATQVFDVSVTDINDNPPVFKNGGDFTIKVLENNTINDVVTLIEATDADVGENAALSYSLLNDSGGFFSIPYGANVLLSAKVLDRETKDSHVVQVLVQDGGTRPLSATGTVTILVEDVNDVAPKFFQSRYTFSLRENLPAGTFIGAVSAFDLDLGDNAALEFSIPSWSDDSRTFQMLPNGTLITKVALNRESVASHTFVAEATDKGRPPMSSQVTIEVEVMDENDNPPVFTFPSSINSSVSLQLPAKASTTVVILLATDADEGSNGEVRYILSPQNASLFHLDPVTGELITARALTTDDSGIYNLTVTATDAGSTPMTTTRKFSVVVKVFPGMEAVKDNNDHAAIAIGLVCGTAFVAIVIVLIVCYVKRREKSENKEKQLRYLEPGKGDNPSSPPRVLDATQLPNHYDEHKEPNNNGMSNGDAHAIKPNHVPKLSVGYPKFDQTEMQAQPRIVSSVGAEVKGDAVDSRDKELNRVTSLRLQQAFEHISSIKSRLITPSDTAKPYEWREIHIPGHPGDFGSLSSRGTTTNTHSNSNGTYNPYALDSGIGTDDDAVFATNTSTSPNPLNVSKTIANGSIKDRHQQNGSPNGHAHHYHKTNNNSSSSYSRRHNSSATPIKTPKSDNLGNNYRRQSATSERAYRPRYGSNGHPDNGRGGGGVSGGGLSRGNESDGRFNTLPSSTSASPIRNKLNNLFNYRFNNDSHNGSNGTNHHHNNSRSSNNHNNSIHNTPRRRLFSSQPASDVSGDSSQPSCTSLPNLYLKPGSETFVFRPLSARSSDSFPSETLDDCTTTSGSYSVTMDDQLHLQPHHHHHHHHQHLHHIRHSPSHKGRGTPSGMGSRGKKGSPLHLSELNHIQDVYV